MREYKRAGSLLILFSLVISLFSCGRSSSSPQPNKRIFFDYFDTVGTFYDYTGAEYSHFSPIADRVEAELLEYHRLFDIYNEYDGIVNLASLNKTAGEGARKVDEKIINMLLFAKEMHKITGGEVNVAMGAVLKIWHEYREAGKAIPGKEELISAKAHTDINDIVIDEEAGTVELLDPEMSLDVGAIGKGYAVEMICDALRSEGLSGYLLDVGGNLCAVGTKPDGSGWKTKVRNPDKSSNKPFVYSLELKNNAIVTSGSYERNYTVGGVSYHHIINKDTLMPENYYLSVSVISDSSALSDALSTAIFNMEYKEAESFVNSFSSVIEVILVMPDGEVRKLG